MLLFREKKVHLSLDPRIGGRLSRGASQGQATDVRNLEIDPSRRPIDWGVENEEECDRATIDILSLGSGCGLALLREWHPGRAASRKAPRMPGSKMHDDPVAALG